MPPLNTLTSKLNREQIQGTFQQALGLHQSGDPAAAARLYEAILELEPRHFDSLHMLGVAALQSQQHRQAVDLISRAIAVNPALAPAHLNLAGGYRALGLYEEAVGSCDKAIALRPDFAEAYYSRGLALQNLNRPDEALASFDKAIALRPDFAEAHSDRGDVLVGLQRHEDALASFDRAVALRPDYVEAHYNRGVALQNLNRPDDALASYDRAIALRPDFALAYSNRGNALRDLNRPDDALASYDKAIALGPEYAEAHSNRGDALHDLRRPEDAVASYDKATALRPDYAEAYSNRSNPLRDLKRFEDALASCDRALALRPDSALAHSNRGLALHGLMRLEDALAAYDRAIAIRPDFADAYSNRGRALHHMNRPGDALADYDSAVALRPEFANAHWNKSLALLLLGRLSAGWELHEWRKIRDEPVGDRSFSQPLWLGDEDLAGRSLFVHWEQGFGDTLQFCRYAALVKERGAGVVLSVQDPLVRLLKQLEPEIEVIGGDAQPAAFDYHCPLMSLPLALRTTLETIPAREKYLSADPADRARWEARLPTTARPRIGVVWSGSTLHKNDRNRSLALSQLAPLFDLDVEWVCLQKEVRDSDAATLRQRRQMRFFDDLGDFGDTAALIERLDLVVTVDTSVAHLAGAMGKPVWVLLPFNPDWRWLLDRQDSPWYPSARLFRQPGPNDWAAVVDHVRLQLIAYGSATPQQSRPISGTSAGPVVPVPASPFRL